MANGPTLPPQAYTREILTAAFNWLQSQPESVRKLATTPDALVGLFMRAQRYGNSTLESDAPVSSQNFMSDLKSLAEGLKQFEQPQSQNQNHNQNQPQFHAQTLSSMREQTHHPSYPGAAPVQHTTGYQAQHHSQQHHPISPAQAAQLTSQMQAQIPLQTPATLPNPESLRSAPSSLPALNEMSLRMVHEIRNHLNLSTDAEAINMMLALAYKNLKNLLG